MHAVDNIEENHCNNNKVEVNEIAEVKDNIPVALSKETPKSNKVKKLKLDQSIEGNQITKFNENLNVSHNSPKYASTPTTTSSEPKFVTARNLLETSSKQNISDIINSIQYLYL